MDSGERTRLACSARRLAEQPQQDAVTNPMFPASRRKRHASRVRSPDSFITKCDHGIDFHRAARGDEAGKKRGASKQQNHSRVREDVTRADAEK